MILLFHYNIWKFFRNESRVWIRFFREKFVSLFVILSRRCNIEYKNVNFYYFIKFDLAVVQVSSEIVGHSNRQSVRAE